MITKTFEKRIAHLEQLTAESQKIPRQDFTPVQLERLYGWVTERISGEGFDLTDGTENALVHLMAITKAKDERRQHAT